MDDLFGQMNSQLYLAYFSAQAHTFQHHGGGAFWEGKLYSSFCQVLAGEVEFQLEDQLLHGVAGDLFYMPEGSRYSSRWIGSPDIEFIGTYSRFFVANELVALRSGGSALVPLDRQFAFQKIEPLCGFRAADEMRELVREYYAGPASQLMAFSRIYRLMSMAFPHLKRQKSQPVSSAILPGLTYLERNFTKNEPVGVYAGLCHLSESRFYHLFRSSMGCSPVEFRNRLRAGYGRQLLADPALSLEEVGARLGFESPEYFRRVFRRYNRVSPSQYRRRKSFPGF